MKNRLFCSLLILMLLPFPAEADDLREVVSAGPSWDTFTHRDGSGLYHEALKEIFALYGITVRHEYVPTNRGDELVRLGQADIMACDDRATAPLVSGRYPLYVDDFFAFFNKARVGKWTGPEMLRDRDVATQKGYYHQWDFPVPVRLRELPTGPKCLEMVLLGRSDFYVDDMTFIKSSMRETDLPFDPDAFDTKKVGTRSYHPLFNQTPRGEKVRKMFEKGIMILHKEGKLKPIYDRWGHDYPKFDEF